MIAFCTYCSRQKNPAEGNLEAIRRYQSERIEKVYRAARTVGVKILILSGEFGLLLPESPIPNYDHLLRAEEVGLLLGKLVYQIQAEAITGFAYFTRPIDEDQNVRPYHDALAAACARLQVQFLSISISGL